MMVCISNLIETQYHHRDTGRDREWVRGREVEQLKGTITHIALTLITHTDTGTKIKGEDKDKDKDSPLMSQH